MLSSLRDQLSLFGGSEPQPRQPCDVRLWLRCRACGQTRMRELSCARPCSRCPWGPMRVSAALARLPRVPLAHWVLAPPLRWARVLPADAAAAQRFRRSVVQRVVTTIEARARDELGHGRGRAGALAVLHTVGSDLRPRAHVHVIATDGVFVPAASGVASFVPLTHRFDARTIREVARAVAAAAREVLPDPGEGEARAPDHRIRPAGASPSPSRQGQVAHRGGADVFVGERVEAHDRRAVAGLAAYVTRPPIHPGAVEPQGDDSVLLRLRETARDGATAVRVSTTELDARVRAVALHHPSRPLSLHGALAPRSSVRWRGDGQQLTLVEGVEPRAQPERTERTERPERCACGGRLDVVLAEPRR